MQIYKKNTKSIAVSNINCKIKIKSKKTNAYDEVDL